MKNDKIYLTLEERIKAFDNYCNSQKECPCKFKNEHCELKWLNEENTDPEKTHKEYRRYFKS